MHNDGKRINDFDFLEPIRRLKRLGHSAASRSEQVVRTKTKGDIFSRQRRSVMESHSLAQEQPQGLRIDPLLTLGQAGPWRHIMGMVEGDQRFQKLRHGPANGSIGRDDRV
nr:MULTISPECIES: hypothetical protein [unclassified Bradyrhizobium]